MGNKKIFVLFLLFLTFININASSLDNYDTSIRSANKYINTNEVHKLYFINGDNMFFGFNNKKIIRDTKFTSGGLLNIDEYDISHYENKTYLNGINNYWTMNYSDYNAYKIDLQKYNVLRNERSKTRVTEYIYKETKVSGSGTYKDPWTFPNMYLVEVESTDNNRGKIIESRKYVLDSKDVSFEVAPMEGYTYESNTCNTTEASDYGLNIRNVKQNIKCSVSFKPKTYTITYDNNGGSGCTNKNIIFNSTYGELCIPIKDGYTFMGWFNNDETVQITKDTQVTNAPYKTLYAKWLPTKVTCNMLEGKVKCNNLSVDGDYLINYDGDCEFICDNLDTGDWRIKFKSIGAKSFENKIDLKLDVFLVGGGGNGSSGGGGGGGYTNTFKQITFKKSDAYVFKVGNAAQSTTLTGEGLNYSVNPGSNGNGLEGGNGGSGGGGQAIMIEGNIWGGSGGSYGKNGGTGYGCTYPGCDGYKGGKGQGSTTCEFGEGTTSKCTRGSSFAYSGGGGGNYYAWNDTFGYQSGLGGTRGGGRAGGASGAANTGGGGGAGGGKGGSGIIIIRNAR